MKTDVAVKKEVLDELEWKPRVSAMRIGVAAKDAMVTLSGEVASYHEKVEAERAALRVEGVTGIARELEIRLLRTSHRSDADIARTAVDALHGNSSVPPDRVRVVVKQGWVMLEGDVDWGYQRTAAEDAVRRRMGVVGVSNAVKVRPTSAAIKTRIEQAFKRNAEIDASRIAAEITDSTVTLRGTVRSWVEKQEAERVARASPGVSSVQNRLEIGA